MSDWTLFHNPRCSKSREALALLEKAGVKPRVVEYLKTPLDLEALRVLARRLTLRPKDFLRAKEPVWETLGLDVEDDEAVLKAMVAHPVLVERPIAVRDERAVLGRPPERLRALLLALLLILLVPGCAPRSVRIEILCGMGRPGGGTVTQAEWQGFLDREVTPRFPQGITVLGAEGRWKGGREDSRVLLLVLEDTPSAQASARDVADAYKRVFGQEAVLLLASPTSAEFR